MVSCIKVRMKCPPTVDMSESRTLTAKAVPQANGCKTFYQLWFHYNTVDYTCFTEAYRKKERLKLKNPKSDFTIFFIFNSKDIYLCEVKLGVWVVIIIIRINELKKKPNDFPKLKIQSYLDIAVIDQFCDHGHAGTKDHPTPLEHDCIAERTPGGRRDWRLGQRAKGVVEGHRLDVQCRQDGLLVRKVRIITCRWNLRQTICNIFK